MASVRATEIGVEFLDRRHDFPPMADDSDAEVLEVVDRQLRQHRAVDLIVPERRLILPEAEAPQPDPDIHRCFLRGAKVDDRLTNSQCLPLWLSTVVWVG